MMSLTGVILVFHEELSAILCPQAELNVDAKNVSFNQIRKNLGTYDSDLNLTSFILSSKKNKPISVWVIDKKSNSVQLQANPATGEILGIKPENAFLKFMRDLHFNLVFGTTGRTANGVGAAFLLLMTMSGLVVWFRGTGRWLSGFKLRMGGSPRSNAWNIHSASGIWSLPLLLIWSISGIWFGFPVVFEKAVNTFLPVSSQQKEIGSVQRKFVSNKEIDLDRIMKTTIDAVPNAVSINRLSLTTKRSSTINVWVSTSNSDDATKVVIDPSTLKITSIVNPQKVPSGDAFLKLLAQLHFGTFLGTISKCIWCIVGLLPGVLAVSALYLFGFKFIEKKKKA